jgi:hypothetical protein
MIKPILQLGNSNNWSAIWSGSFVAATDPDGSYFPLSAIAVPVLLENHTIAIVCSSSSAKPSWRIAGNVGRKIQTGITIGGNPDTTIPSGQLLRLDRINLVRFEQITSNYALEILPKFWLKDLSINVFGYTGIESDTVTEQLNRIEQTIDSLNLL